jgi:PAS domain S-box-containing protein
VADQTPADRHDIRRRRTVPALIAGYFVVLIVILAVTVPTLVSTLTTLDRQESTYDVASRATSQLLVSALNQETGIRGYALSGQQSFLQPFSLGSRQFTDSVKTLRGAPLGPVFSRELRSTVAALNTWRASAIKATLDTSQHGDSGSAPALAAQARVKKQFDEFRMHQALLASTVRQDLANSTRSLHATVERSIFLLIGATAVGITLGCVIWVRWYVWGRQAETREQELARRAILLQSALDASSEGIYAKDLGGRHIVANRARAAALTGGDGDADLIGHTVHEFVHPEIADDLRRNEEIVVRTGRERQFQEVLPFPDGPHVFSMTKSPMRGPDGVVEGVVGISRDITKEVALLADRERLYQLEHRLAQSLQEAMLGNDAIDDRRIDVCAKYLPASDELEVGGDWYDILPVSKDRVALIVGDAVGHGIDSVTAMGQLRSALAALTYLETDPAETLEVLDMFAMGLPHARWATCVLALIDPEKQELTYSCAGHMPPIVVTPSSDPEILSERQDPPLAMQLAERRRTNTIPFPPGSVVVLYTDGLVERRNELIDKGLSRLAALVEDVGDGSMEKFCDRSIRHLVQTDMAHDDIAIIAARLSPD